MRQIGQIALATPGLSRLRRMSPEEVWHKHADGLQRLPHWAVVDFLGDECFRRVRVGHDGLIAFQDRDLTGSAVKLRFAGAVMQPDGTGCRLARGAEYGLYVLPHDLTKAVIVEAGTRAVLGIAPAWSAVDPLNAAQVAVMQEAQAKMIALQSQGVRERHAERGDELAVRREENDLLLAGLTEPRRQKTKKQAKQQKQAAGQAMRALAGMRSDANASEVEDEW